MSQVSASGRPGRYQRSAGGLVGAMVILILVVLGFVVFRGAFRETPQYEATPVDYLALVRSVQESGHRPVYPATLPEGWFAKDVSYKPGREPVLDIALSTADGEFAGIHEQDEALGELVSTYVDEAATQGPRVRTPGAVAPVWQTFSDSGGDHAFAADIGGEYVLVYGSAPEDQLRDLLHRLSTKMLPARDAS